MNTSVTIHCDGVGDAHKSTRESIATFVNVTIAGHQFGWSLQGDAHAEATLGEHDILMTDALAADLLPAIAAAHGSQPLPQTRRRYLFVCAICGIRREAVHEKLVPIFDTLATHRIETISLTAVGARL